MVLFHRQIEKMAQTKDLQYFYVSIIFLIKGVCWEHSGSVVENLTQDRGATASSLNRLHCVVSLSKTHLSLLSTGSTQEDPSGHN